METGSPQLSNAPESGKPSENLPTGEGGEKGSLESSVKQKTEPSSKADPAVSSATPGSSGVSSFQLPPSEGNVSTASAAALAAAAIKAKVEEGEGEGRS